MNREEKIRRALPSASDDMVALLAGKSAAEVDEIVQVARMASRQAVEADKDRRRQRREDARNHHWYDESELTDRVVRLVRSSGRRVSLDALHGMWLIQRATGEQVAAAVYQLRGQGYSDTEIGEALGGITKQAVSQRFPRKAALSADPGSEGNRAMP